MPSSEENEAPLKVTFEKIHKTLYSLYICLEGDRTAEHGILHQSRVTLYYSHSLKSVALGQSEKSLGTAKSDTEVTNELLNYCIANKIKITCSKK